MHTLTCHLLAYSSKSVLAQLSNGFKILIVENLTWPEILTDKVNLQASFLILVHEIKKKKTQESKKFVWSNWPANQPTLPLDRQMNEENYTKLQTWFSRKLGFLPPVSILNSDYYFALSYKAFQNVQI